MRQLSAEEKEQKALKRSLRATQTNAAFTSIMESATTPFLTPFALLLNASNLVIGLLASFPGLIAAFFQVIAAQVEHLVHSRKQIIALGTFLQAILWIPILFVPFIEPSFIRPWALLLLVTLVTIVGQLIMPSWKSLLGDIIPEDHRGKYFSERNKIVGLCSFCTVLSAGFILDYFRLKQPVIAFMILIVAAVISRILSISTLYQIYDPKKVTLTKNPTLLEAIEAQEAIRKSKGPGFFQFLKYISKDQYGKFVLFMFLFKLVNSIAAPFFAVYMLKVLQISYWQFTILAASELFASLLVMKFWGRFDDESGSRRVVFITTILICFKPLLWLFGGNFFYLLVIHIFSGIVYAGFNIASETFMYDATEPENRTTQAAYLALLQGIGIFIGSTLGGNLLSFAIITIPVLFVISGLGRILVAMTMLPGLREMRLVEISFDKSVLHAPLYIKAHGGYEFHAMTTHDIKNATSWSSRKAHSLSADEKYWREKKQDKSVTKESSIHYSDGSSANHTKSHLNRNDPEVKEFLRRMLKK